MDAPTLKAFLSPRCPSRRNISYLETTSRPGTTKNQSSKNLHLLDKQSLNNYIKELQSSIKQECTRLQSKLRVSQERHGSSSKYNIPQQNTTYKSCYNLKKPQSRSVLYGHRRQNSSRAKQITEMPATLDKSSKKMPKLAVSTEGEWIPNRKLYAMLGQVQTTTHLLTKTLEKYAGTPKPKTIKSLFQKKSEKYLKRAPTKSIISALSLKNFTIVKKLGKGRFGNVYLAQYRYSKAVFALKSISKKTLTENSMENQLVQEIKIQTYLRHPNLLKMYGFFSDNENIYLILEDALGGNMFRYLRNEKRFSERKCAVYLRQVCYALSYLHQHSIIHRDIKPYNILISNGVLKLSDFGWSVYSPEQPRYTFCGTLDYVSPYIVVGKTYDNKVDLWSIGVLCYEMATGKAPFENQGHRDETYEKIVRNYYDFPEYLSSGICDFINRLLVRNPKKRMSLEEALQHYWLVENGKGGFSVSREIFNLYTAI